MTLTPAGWPRPIVDGWPIPWVSPPHDLSEMNTARAAASASSAICAVCGRDHPEDTTAFALVRAETRPPDLGSIDVQAMDNAVMHRECALLALSQCPALKRLIEANVLHIVAVPANEATIVATDGKPMARFNGADCSIVTLADLKQL